jgi:alanine racemase
MDDLSGTIDVHRRRHAILAVDHARIVANWRWFGAAAKGAATGAAVKADAYGHGLASTGKALAAAGCRHFFVAATGEGNDLRRAVGAGPAILVLGGPIDAADLAACKLADLTPVLNTARQVALWTTLGTGMPAALHIDTGINRLGVAPDQLADVAVAFAQAPPALLLTHFACADEPHSALNAAQVAAFLAARAAFPTAPISASNSPAALAGLMSAEDVSRPGIGLYGASPAFPAPRPPGLEQAMTLTAPVLQLRTLPVGAGVGYGQSWITPGDRRIATIAAGYADGLHRALSNRGAVRIGDVSAPIVGRVSMDMITVDATDAGDVAEGDMAELLGDGMPVEAVAAAAGTIPYEVFCAVGAAARSSCES